MLDCAGGVPVFTLAGRVGSPVDRPVGSLSQSVGGRGIAYIGYCNHRDSRSGVYRGDDPEAGVRQFH